MLTSEICSSIDTAKKRRYFFNKKKLEALQFYRDSLERRIAAINASIDTIQLQLKRDVEVQTD